MFGVVSGVPFAVRRDFKKVWKSLYVAISLLYKYRGSTSTDVERIRSVVQHRVNGSTVDIAIAGKGEGKRALGKLKAYALLSLSVPIHSSNWGKLLRAARSPNDSRCLVLMEKKNFAKLISTQIVGKPYFPLSTIFSIVHLSTWRS